MSSTKQEAIQIKLISSTKQEVLRTIAQMLEDVKLVRYKWVLDQSTMKKKKVTQSFL